MQLENLLLFAHSRVYLVGLEFPLKIAAACLFRQVSCFGSAPGVTTLAGIFLNPDDYDDSAVLVRRKMHGSANRH